MVKTLDDLAPSSQVTRWASAGFGGGFVRTNLVVLHESVGATDAIGLADYCERIGVSYNAIADLADGGRIVYTVPRTERAFHTPQGVNYYANGLCLTTPVAGYSRTEWLGPQRRKVEIAAWYMAVVCAAEQLDIIQMSAQNILDAVYNDDHRAGGVTTHRDCDAATRDPTPHVDPRNFPMDVAVRWAQGAAGYSDWQNRDQPPPEPKPEPEPPVPEQAVALYEVQPGDTLWGIVAGLHGTSIDAVAEASGLTNPGALTVGQTLRIPL